MLETGPSRGPTLSGALRVYLLALLVGLMVGTLASAFHYCLEGAYYLHGAFSRLFAGATMTAPMVAALLGAAMAGTAFVLVRRLAPEAAGSGIQEIEGAMEGVRVVRWRRVIGVKFVGGVLAIGSGLVLGREGPTVHMGGCIGRMIGEKAKSGADVMNTLLAAGAAAGLTAAFSAPLAGVMLVTEEMRHRFTYTFVSLHAIILACVTAELVNGQLFGQIPALPIQMAAWLSKTPYTQEALVLQPLYLVLGGVIGVFGVGFNRVLLGCLHLTDRLGGVTMFIVAASCGGLAGALMVLAPAFAGGGESVVKEAFSQSPSLVVLLALLMARTFMTFLSYSAGVPGGIFAPMLALGTLIGMSFGYAAQELLPSYNLQVGAFAIAAMGGLFAATVRAPLTGVVLVAELTSSFELLPAMILTCMTASITAQSLGSRPIYESLLTRTLESTTKRTSSEG